MTERKNTRLKTYATNIWDYGPDIFKGTIEAWRKKDIPLLIGESIVGGVVGSLVGVFAMYGSILNIDALGQIIWGNNFETVANGPIFDALAFTALTLPFYGAGIGATWSAAKIGRDKRHAEQIEKQQTSRKSSIQ